MADQGASPKELLFEACRRNNTDLISEVLHGQPPAKLAAFLNESKDGTGNFAMHIAASAGSYEVLDVLLDQEGLEVDPINRMEGDTPLHSAIRWVNELDKSDWEAGISVVSLLIDAGCDPRIPNKDKTTPLQLVDPRNTDLRLAIQKAEYSQQIPNDVVVDEDDYDEATGSGSDDERVR